MLLIMRLHKLPCIEVGGWVFDPQYVQLLLCLLSDGLMATEEGHKAKPCAPTESIHRAAEKNSSRKPAFIHPHTYTVPGRRHAGLISKLPRRVLLGNLPYRR